MLRYARLAGLALLALPAAAQTDYVADVKYAIEQVDKECAELLRTKSIDWRKATAPLLEEAKAVRDDGEHWVLLTRLLARLQDGHAEVQQLPSGSGVQWPASR